MQRKLTWIVVLICAAPLCLAAQNHSGMSHNASPAQSAATMPQPLQDAMKRPPMGLKQFEDLALANNPTLKQANDLVARSKGQARQAGLYPNPSVGYEGSEIRGGSFGGGEHGAFVQQTIVLGGKLGRRRRVLQEQQREDEAGATVKHEGLLSDVDQRFYSALSAQETVKLRQKLLKIALDAAETAHQLANVGQADAPDVLQAEVEADQAKADDVTAQMNYIQAFETLAATVGKPDLPVSPLEGGLADWPKLHPDEIIETILRESPSVKRAEAAVGRAKAQLQSAKHEAVPDLRLRAGVQQDNEALNEAAPRPGTVGVVGFASVGVNIPIFNRNQGNVAAARAELDRAREEVTRVQLALRRSAEPLLRSYQADEAQATDYKSTMLPKAMRAYQLYLNKYRQMGAAYPMVLVSQRTWFELQVRYIETLEHLWSNAIALQHFTLTDGLDALSPSGNSSTTLNLPNGEGGAME
ncbi:MAG TPA: TolC family protein [Terriglobia bacterium]|nr:TolC family protein [Terriglobia bacterium]